MNIVVINGTEQRGCTYQIKERFLAAMGGGHTVTEFILPKDCPAFCTGCKACFYKDMTVCPHAEYTIPIWESIQAADLLVFASPVYVFHATAQMKALLDHLGTKWMAHSPEGVMFRKQAVILVNAIGQGMGKAAKDIKDSLDFWGVARTYVVKQALFQGKWELVSDKTKEKLAGKCANIAAKVQSARQVKPRLKIKALFFIMKMAQKMIDKSERKAGRPRTADYLHWEKNGWLSGKKPWKERV
jgi:multimeric flavodoxin WrbA